ncbi:carbohydrate ABC transporter permease [Anaeromassilibacillus sp. An200]|uniref:Carbohydrate ABC transporter permease n=1 Tax=Candidatus Caccousia stercoris TaxID=2840723 RepID=A0A9D1FR02_9FIRM|nr:carbohydrate ABC transporter permease [Anaeromassilibacillus sp. An200]OUP13157.1 sugar ABC transporter permease [Anaeromassilibacillus sp. An200]HIS77740.1 carbohydrate ABC transporter permease [Candidatus Caccousia stercoris]
MKYFKKKAGGSGDDLAVNRISTKTNVILNVVFLFWTLVCVLPLILVVIVSFSSEQSIFQNGYTFFPSEWSLDAYNFFFKLGDQLLRSYGITIFVTVVGTLFSLAITAMFAYVLSRNDYAYNRIFTFLMLFTMLFNGGIVATYMVNTQLLKLGDSVGALIFPMSLNAFYVIVLRTFYKGIPMEIIEAARIDGAGEFKTFFSIVLPLSKPGLATIGMFTTIAYWNDWFLGMLYIVDQKKYPVQTLLWSMQNSLEFMKQSSANALEYAEMAANAPTDSGRMALTVLVVLPILLAYPFFQKYFVKGLTVGGVKG